MEKLGWKITAIVFISLFALLLAFNVWGYCLVIEEENAINDCYYNTCADYPEAWYEDGVCACYDLDEYGEYEIAKTIYVS
jgi:hypothetical protein